MQGYKDTKDTIYRNTIASQPGGPSIEGPADIHVYIYIYIYTSVNPCISMHGAEWSGGK